MCVCVCYLPGTSSTTYVQLAAANHLGISLVRCIFHWNRFFPRTTVLWIRISSKCFSDHYSLNLFIPRLTMIFVTYPHQLCLFFCYPYNSRVSGYLLIMVPCKPLLKSIVRAFLFPLSFTQTPLPSILLQIQPMYSRML